MKDWFGADRYRLSHVSAAAKLLSRDPSISTLLLEKPRPILTPPIVWTGLLQLSSEQQNVQFITLSEYDDAPLLAGSSTDTPPNSVQWGVLFILN